MGKCVHISILALSANDIMITFQHSWLTHFYPCLNLPSKFYKLCFSWYIKTVAGIAKPFLCTILYSQTSENTHCCSTHVPGLMPFTTECWDTLSPAEHVQLNLNAGLLLIWIGRIHYSPCTNGKFCGWIKLCIACLLYEKCFGNWRDWRGALSRLYSHNFPALLWH